VVEQAVDIPPIGKNSDMPAWARRFLDQGKGLNAITWMRAPKRKALFERSYLPDCLSVVTTHVQFNALGQAVFRWENEDVRDKFLQKWESN
jgi:hypothetical protein